MRIYCTYANPVPLCSETPRALLRRIGAGLAIGLLIGAIVSIFRISSSYVYAEVINWAGAEGRFLPAALLLIAAALVAGLIVGQLVRNPAISFGGADWIRHAIACGQPRVWRLILLPKFIGSWLVMACCVSVGREGPCIQMGAACAEGLKHFDAQNAIERRHYILTGCAAGLAAAFSAPFAGICYVYEIMREKLDTPLFVFMLAAGMGVYLACTQIFGLDVMLPLGATPMPPLAWLWTLIPLSCAVGAVGIAYNYLLHFSVKIYSTQKLVPVAWRPLFAFGAAALMILIFPAITGEGLTIFSGVSPTVSFLCIFLIAKLFFTAFCYGSFIPAGLMVPIICLGGVTGSIYAHCLSAFNPLPAGCAASFIAMGMAGAFAAAERAPLTGLVLIAEMTASWAAAPGLLIVGAIAAFLAKIARVKTV